MLREVHTNRGLKSFLYFPHWLRSSEKYWIAPHTNAIKMYFNRKKNPLFEYGDARLYLAMKDKRVAGRVAIFANHAEMQRDEKQIRFGFLEFENDREVSGALVEGIINSAKELGAERIIGLSGFFATAPTTLVKTVSSKYHLPGAQPDYFFSHLREAGFQLIQNSQFYEYTSEIPFSECHIYPKSETLARLVRQHLPKDVSIFEAQNLWQSGRRILKSGQSEIQFSVHGAKAFSLIQKRKYRVAVLHFTHQTTTLNEHEMAGVMGFLQKYFADRVYLQTTDENKPFHSEWRKVGDEVEVLYG